MKSAVIILSILSIALASAWFMGRSKADAKTTALQTEITALNTQLALSRAKLGEQEQSSAQLQATLKQDLNTFSNRVASARASLEKSESTAHGAQARAGESERRLAELEMSRNALIEKLGTVQATLDQRDFEVTNAREQLQATEEDRAILWRELQRSEAEKGKLAHSFTDLFSVRSQLAKLEQEQASKNRLAKGARKEARLEWQPDGTVKLIADGPTAESN